jgi:hypothetical protein
MVHLSTILRSSWFIGGVIIVLLTLVAFWAYRKYSLHRVHVIDKYLCGESNKLHIQLAQKNTELKALQEEYKKTLAASNKAEREKARQKLEACQAQLTKMNAKSVAIESQKSKLGTTTTVLSSSSTSPSSASSSSPVSATSTKRTKKVDNESNDNEDE